MTFASLRTIVIAVATVYASIVFAESGPLPEHCPATKAPIMSPTAAVCAAIQHLGRDTLQGGRYRYDVRETTAGIWHVRISPVGDNILGGGRVVDLAKETGAIVGGYGTQ